MQPHISKHAKIRMNQRGVSNEFLSDLVANADIELSADSGCALLRVSKRRSEYLNIDDRLYRYGVILSEDGTIVTVLPVYSSKSGKRYRAGQH